MNFAAFGACGRHIRRHRAQEYAGAGICRGRNNPPNEYAGNKEGWQEPGIFRNSPTPSFRKRP